MTYEQIVTLAHLLFKMLVIYRIIASIPFIIGSIPKIIVSCSEAVTAKQERDIKAEREKLRVEGFKDHEEKQRSNYKRTNIGFTTTCPVDRIEP